MAENSIFLIDIDKVLKDKAGEKAVLSCPFSSALSIRMR